MKWGVRRYQNKDGTLTSAGRKRLYKDLKTASKNNDPDSIDKKYNKQLRPGVKAVKKTYFDSLEGTKEVTAHELESVGHRAAKELIGKYGNRKLSTFNGKTVKAEEYLAMLIDRQGVYEGGKAYDERHGYRD